MTRKRNLYSSSVEHLQLSELTTINGHVVQYFEKQRLLLIDGQILHCTPTEYPLLLCLLEQSGTAVPFAHLVQRGLHSPLDRYSRHSLTQHIVRLRRKLHPFGMQLQSVTAVGYQLFVEPADSTNNRQEADHFSEENATG
jgi:DNA-binding response OmpR family regulator